MNEELLRVGLQVLLGLYLAFNAAWRLNRLNGSFSLHLATGYVLMGAAAFLVAVQPFSVHSLMNWGELTLLLGLSLVTIPYDTIWKEPSLVSHLTFGKFKISSLLFSSRKGITLMSAILATGLFLADKFLLSESGPPVQILSTTAETILVKEGEPLKITYVVSRTRHCPATINGAIIPVNDDPAKPTWYLRLAPVPAGFSRIGTSTIQRRIKTVGKDVFGDEYALMPGAYTYTSFSTHVCAVGNGEKSVEYVVRTPAVNFYIKGKGTNGSAGVSNRPGY